MALRIRLQRCGAKNSPSYKVVVAESSSRRDGRFVEILGHYNPTARGNAEKMRVNTERAEYWISNGAKPSDTARHILNKCKTEVVA